MTKYLTTDIALKSVADTIRAKGKTTEQLTWPTGYNTAINAISAIDLCISSSSPASRAVVDDAANVDAKRVVVGIEPVQDLHGYDNPWPAGGGKNKFNIEDISSTNSNVTITKTSDSFTLTYISNSGLGSVNAFDGNNNIWYLQPGQYTISIGTVISININIYGSATSDGSYTLIDDGIIAGNLAKTFTVSAEKPYISFKCLVRANNSVTINQFQFESGSTATTYAPYSNICPITGWAEAHIYVSPTQDAQDGTTYSITFPPSAGTVYGGTLDMTNGVLTVDRAMVTFNGGSSEQWWLAQDYTNRFGNNKTGTFCDGIVEHQISNWLKSSSWGNTSFTFGLRSDGSLYICLDASAEQITEAQFRAYLASTPLQIVYTLATPVTYDLTPQDIELLSGYNVIFADCGGVALSYYTEDFADLADEIGFAEGGDY